MKYKTLSRNIVDKSKRKHYTEIMKRAYVALALVAVIVTLYSGAMIALSNVKNAKADTFDHSQCQYPNRETNPVDGCDNSDPACPETIKYGYDCQPSTPAVEPAPTTPVTPTAPAAPVVTPTPTSCGK